MNPGEEPSRRPERTYYEIARESNVIPVVMVLALFAVTWIWYGITGEMTQAGIINRQIMMALRAPVLALTILVWAWGFVTRVRMLGE